MPVLEGLFPDTEHDKHIQDLVFIMAEWHACAKLRLHTDSTINTLRELTRTFGFKIRHFAKKISNLYDTRELPREEAARVRRRAKKSSQTARNANTVPPANGPLRKMFNLLTYKLHALGDYVFHIIRFGTTDSYSTQTVNLYYLHIHPVTLMSSLLYYRVNSSIVVLNATTDVSTKPRLFAIFLV